MANEPTDEQRLEAALRRLSLLPERKNEIGRAVTGLIFAIRATAPIPNEIDAARAAEDERAKEQRDANIAAAQEIRDVEWAIFDLKEAWDRLSPKARHSLVTGLRSSGKLAVDFLTIMEQHAKVVEFVSLTADQLQSPEQPIPSRSGEDRALLMVQHAARLYTRLTGKTPPKPLPGEPIIPSSFFWLLEDIFRVAGITSGVEKYIRTLAQP
jgi:hypothetical protein